MIVSFEGLAIFGIFLEIAGFLLMLKWYGKNPTSIDLDNWMERWKNRNQMAIPRKNLKNMEIETPNRAQRLTEDVPQKFYYYWTSKKQSPIYMVIAGLSFQIAQLAAD